MKSKSHIGERRKEDIVRMGCEWEVRLAVFWNSL